ncbi:hypothetical protein RCL_jg144.t1 [Rhizophagus clarus]|uniref:Uncharacterized protein n=1 Tax=Rhizophagus clarus TaxID=94130 RepID=A0A8H3MEQ1_9GLOM|nr:hypothetical protein RCL_jg144.t1 [Rhizophagus clarus]
MFARYLISDVPANVGENNYNIRLSKAWAFKEVKNPDNRGKMIAYFESWETYKTLDKDSFWNGTNSVGVAIPCRYLLREGRLVGWSSSNSKTIPTSESRPAFQTYQT